MKQFLRIGAGLVAAAVMTVELSGCAGAGAYPPAPRKAQTPDHRYKIGPLDTLNIVVWRNPEVSGVVTVRPDGRISTPLVSDVLAAGKNPSDLALEIQQELSRVIRDPVVTVVVSTFQGNLTDQIRIVGEASKPQSVAYRQDMTVLDVMIQAGGLTDFADGNAAVLVRGSEGGKQYSIRLKDLLKRGDISANVDVKPGDIVIVPQSWF
ncbi:MAG TPA: polysaccharide export protein [Burkholderiaceae bacterium]|nr:polysaccharide export protein [Burkholderiaceae bacterium]HMX10036.1 polysaccharide export protein [Burkholderiaceae bacterium]HMY98309.1 polysaccharide export protein [Burkholderiaceae bacterium]HNB42758.1 polysaccharide export protein [Burkholderiaceae bacterium]HNG77898.1 polysaccharide export protein [Burkholderiaceae bacterium]